MKTKKIIALILPALVILSFAGCQLARGDAGENPDAGRLVGVFITTEYLDLFDMEGYLNDNLSGLSGGEINMDGDAGAYQGRLYAVLTERELTGEDTGEKTLIEEYVFEGVAGISYFVARFPDKENIEGYWGNSSDDAVSDGHVAFSYGDEADSITLEGTLYVSPGIFGKTYYINPVYQSADGRVYTVTGSGSRVDGVQDEGSAFSQTLDETKTITDNGESKTESISIKISIAAMSTPRQIVILQMDKDSKIVSRSVYTPGAVPGKLVTDRETEYIVLETHKTDSAGGPVVTREMFSKKDEALAAFYCRDDGICVNQWVQVIW